MGRARSRVAAVRVVGSEGQRTYSPTDAPEASPTGGARGAHNEAFGAVLRVRCWCERSEVEVPALDVSRGATRSCGRSGCKPAKASA